MTGAGDPATEYPTVDVDKSIVITDDVSTLPSADDILRSFRKHATVATAKASLFIVALMLVVQSVGYARTGDTFTLVSLTAWSLIGASFVVGALVASRSREMGAYAVLSGVAVAVVLQSFESSEILTVMGFSLGYPIVYLCAMGLAPPEHFRLWTISMPLVFLANLYCRQWIRPLDVLADPLNQAAIVGGSALGMVIVGRLAEGLFRTLRRSLLFSEMTRRGLQRTQREMVAHRNALETRVHERTRDLAAKNHSLAEALASLQRTQAQLVHSEKMASLGLLVAGIAHEIKNPLNFVNNFAELAIEFAEEHRASLRASSDEKLVKAESAIDDIVDNLHRIREHGQRADRIINAMLMHARDRRGEALPVDFNAMVIEHVNLAYQGFRATDRAFTIDIAPSIDPRIERVVVPYQELARVVVNLVSNACHAMRERQRTDGPSYRPALHVGTRRDGLTVELTIKDNGIGIAPEVRSRLFDPFFTTKPPGEGTGLGLSLSYEIIVKELGGTIDVASEIGSGALFTVRIPAPPAVESD